MSRAKDWTDFNRRFSEAVWSARVDCGWTQVELSRRTGIPVKTISRIETFIIGHDSYKRRPHMVTIKKLVDVLEIDEEYLRLNRFF